ncbi:MAG: SAM-dependent methyltransferase [Bianqueaceae bacterium]
MKQMELTARLKQIADMVPQGFSVADIGTDHGISDLFGCKGIIPVCWRATFDRDRWRARKPMWSMA